MPILVLFGVFTVGIVTFHLLEPVAPIKSGYRSGVFRRGYFADVVSTLVNGPGLSSLTKIAAIYLVTRVPAQWRFMADWSFVAQFIPFFLVNDFGRYWLHRWYHASPLLWRFHRVHHTVVEMDSLSLFRIHVGEAVIKNGLLFLPFQLIGVSPWVIVVYSSWDILKGFWHHANLRTYVGPVNYFFNTAELHWWHHSTESRGQQANYGSILSIWDRLFHTFYWPRGEWPEQIGVEGIDHFPDSYLGQFTSVVHDDRSAAECYARKARGNPRRDSESSAATIDGVCDATPQSKLAPGNP